MTIGFTWYDHTDLTYDEVDALEECYFSLAWSTMGRFTRRMLYLGMAYPSDPGSPPDDLALMDKWYRCAGVEERPGIPSHKLSSNDDWQITDIELRGALLADDAGDIAPDDPMWAPFIAWLRGAIEHGGAVVS